MAERLTVDQPWPISESQETILRYDENVYGHVDVAKRVPNPDALFARTIRLPQHDKEVSVAVPVGLPA